MSEPTPKAYGPPPPLRWRVWWRFGFPPVIWFISLLPISEWRQERWIQRVDFWAMDHIGRSRPPSSDRGAPR